MQLRLDQQSDRESDRESDHESDHSTDTAAPLSTVTVDAPARLHLGFLDPSGSLGRAFGSVGLTIDAPGTRITARYADETQVLGAHTDAQRERITHYLGLLHDAYGGRPVLIDVRRAPRAHAGLGSGTQLALAVGTAFVRLLGRPVPTADLARLLGRGARSGIGMLGFDHGGLIVDSGPGAGHGSHPPRRVPSILTRLPFPDTWRILLVDDTRQEGLHGDEERQALATLAPFPEELAAHLCHLVLMLVLPGIAEHDFDAFARGIGELQQTIGEYFAPAQGGIFSSPAVAATLDAAAVATEHRAGIGQTSWGPTGFAFVHSAQDAERALAAAMNAARGIPGIVCSVAAANNRGASIHAGGLQRCTSDLP
ncbi:beta-ribofuranosylaminobenzene 5'-phosphate synthase family protein [Caballeronia sp. LjRoot31]|uniref:beta-ribofuranosylaminobenzene 5'-phosphate synthase family protein n=1 Tax=Caballeronia sp. LjRoot31 TaxID=3342324 RepID=UPI003ECDE1F7